MPAGCSPIERWEALEAEEKKDDDESSIVIIRNWVDFESVRTSDLMDADIVVVAMGLYTSEKYAKFLPACVWSILDAPSQLATSVEKLREIYNSYPEYRSKIESLAIARKQEINAQIINQTKIGNNGT